jgi:hypothetical protein
MDVLEMIPALSVHLEMEMRSWILRDRQIPIEDTIEGYFLCPPCSNPEQLYMKFGEYMGGQKGQDLKDYDRGFFTAVSHFIEVGIDEVGGNQVVKDFWDDYTVIIDVYKHRNEI